MSVVLEFDNVHIQFGMVKPANGLSVTLNDGELVGVIGPNGAGKTTFINLATGYLSPTQGRIRLRGSDITGKSPTVVSRLGVGRSFQIPQLFLGLTVLDNLLIALAARDRKALKMTRPLHRQSRVSEARQLLTQFGLDARAQHKIEELPQGARKILDVVLAYALKPALLLLDEPTSGVSAQDKFRVMDTLVPVLRAGAVTSVFIEHDMDIVRRFANRVLVLDAGRFAADGPPDEILADPDIQRTISGRL